MEFDILIFVFAALAIIFLNINDVHKQNYLLMYVCNGLLLLHGIRVVQVPRTSVVDYVIALMVYLPVIESQTSFAFQFVSRYRIRNRNHDNDTSILINCIIFGVLLRQHIPGHCLFVSNVCIFYSVIFLVYEEIRECWTLPVLHGNMDLILDLLWFFASSILQCQNFHCFYLMLFTDTDYKYALLVILATLLQGLVFLTVLFLIKETI